jgi:hypothetical protein
VRKIRAEDINTDDITALIQLQNKVGLFVVHDASDRPIQGITSEVLLANAELLDILHDSNNSLLQSVNNRLATWLAQTVATKNAFTTPQTINARATFYTLASLQAYDTALVAQAVLAQAVRYLVTNEAAIGGPYKNLAGEVEVETNMAIDRFVRQVAQPLPNLTAYLIKKATKSNDTFYAPARIHANRLLQSAKAAAVNSTHQKSTSTHIPRAIIRAVDTDLQTVPVPMRRDMQTLIDSIMRSNAANEIVALATHFAQALKPHTVRPRVINTLGVANTYTWIAYTLYDDFLDDEGQASKLPLANIALRHGIAAFTRALPDNTAFQKHVATIFDTIETANAWEVAHCRWRVDNRQLYFDKLPKYDDLHILCERSLSHSLPVIGVLVAAGNSLTSNLVRNAQTAFEEYLVIRQLSDDLRDWQEDIQAGHISCVVAQLLQGVNVSQTSMPFAELLPKLEKLFWQITLPALSDEIQIRGKQARQLLNKHRTLAADNILTALIKSLENAAARTRHEQQRADQFLYAYRQN